MSAPRISICIPTLNGEKDLRSLLPRLQAQRIHGGFEIVAIDSSSDDSTRDLLQAAGARVERIERTAFGHGRTRNDLARLARGERIVFLSQDAVPRDDDSVECLVSALDDPHTAGAYARILPHVDDDVLTRRTVLDAPEASSVPHQSGPVENFDALDPLARSNLARFNNVASSIQTAILREIPFPDIAFGEDSSWAARVLAAGYCIRFVPESVFLHAHRYTWSSIRDRNEIDARFQRCEHGWRPRPTAFSLLRGWIAEVRADWRYARSEGAPWRELARSPALRFAQVLGQYRGSRG